MYTKTSRLTVTDMPGDMMLRTHHSMMAPMMTTLHTLSQLRSELSVLERNSFSRRLYSLTCRTIIRAHKAAITATATKNTTSTANGMEGIL